MNLRERALAFLARREHSRAELARKLAAHGATDAVAALLDELEQEGLLSNRRYAEAVAHARLGRHGSLRLKADLREQGVPDAVMGEVLAQARAQDLDAARAVWSKKFGQPAQDAAGRARQIRFLASRGFPPEVVRKVMGDGEAD